MSEDTTAPGLPLASTGRAVTLAWRAGKGRGHYLVMAVLAMTAAALLDLVLPHQAGRVVDAVSAGDGLHMLPLAATLMLGSVVLGGIAGGVGLAAAPGFFAAALARLREDLVRSALRLPHPVVDRVGTADLVARVGDDVARAREASMIVAPRLVSTSVSIIISTAGIGVANPAFLLAIALGAVGYIFVVRWYWPRASAAYVTERTASAVHAGNVLTTVQGLETVQAFGMQAERAATVSAGSWALVQARLRGRRLISVLTVWLLFIEAVTIVALLGIGIVLARSGSVTVGETTAAILILLRLFGPIRFVLFFLDDFQAALIALRRITGVIDFAPAVSVEAEGKPEERVEVDRSQTPLAPGEIRIENVSFAYDDGPPVLDGVNLTVAPAEVVALVGASGAGKSTLSALIAGLLEPQTGAVRVGVAPQRDPELPDVVLLSQDVHTFSGPLRADVLLALPGGLEERDAERRLQDALQRVGATDWVGALPKGADTIVGRLGTRLTAAQAQQLALARILVADPPVVVLDEATAEAGSAGASVLDRAAAEVVRGRSAIVVAHRLSQAVIADRIVVMAQGRIVDAGTPAELIDRPGPFHDLWQAWTTTR
ncbi:ABC transporter ATP-binding protein [Gephyromycinifex aptenodytis]|uniref:ABC transporter ATP-binding protein n=1 Tax=Gephyromycinifex aptenodytis TaxID=2716227 RepID=UPI00144505E2|nr:ABC transporter ATP-binding protein [Gephyromycinifex aptenodytis]